MDLSEILLNDFPDMSTEVHEPPPSTMTSYELPVEEFFPSDLLMDELPSSDPGLLTQMPPSDIPMPPSESEIPPPPPPSDIPMPPSESEIPPPPPPSDVPMPPSESDIPPPPPPSDVPMPPSESEIPPPPPSDIPMPPSESEIPPPPPPSESEIPPSVPRKRRKRKRLTKSEKKSLTEKLSPKPHRFTKDEIKILTINFLTLNVHKYLGIKGKEQEEERLLNILACCFVGVTAADVVAFLKKTFVKKVENYLLQKFSYYHAPRQLLIIRLYYKTGTRVVKDMTTLKFRKETKNKWKKIMSAWKNAKRKTGKKRKREGVVIAGEPPKKKCKVE